MFQISCCELKSFFFFRRYHSTFSICSYCVYLDIGLGDISHAICMRISSVKPVP